MINVRMQNDIRLPVNERRNYKNAIDGLYQVCKHEGVKQLFNGSSMATGRAIMMTIGQLAMYDQFKTMLLVYMPGFFKDNVATHLTASTLAGAAATCVTQPVSYSYFKVIFHFCLHFFSHFNSFQVRCLKNPNDERKSKTKHPQIHK